jgi:hypothetical protein
MDHWVTVPVARWVASLVGQARSGGRKPRASRSTRWRDGDWEKQRDGHEFQSLQTYSNRNEGQWHLSCARPGLAHAITPNQARSWEPEDNEEDRNLASDGSCRRRQSTARHV